MSSENFKVSDNRRKHNDLNNEDRLPEIYKPKDAPPPEKTLNEKIADCFLEPGPGRVIVLPDPFKYHGTMVIPEEGKRTGSTGIILKVGTSCSADFWHPASNDFRCLLPGDRVAYGLWTGILFHFEQRPAYRVLMDNEISCIVVGEATKLLDVEA